MSYAGYALLMLLAGLGIPIGATLNGMLGQKLQSTSSATIMLFAIGFLLALIYGLMVGGIPKTLPKNIPPHFFFGGFFIIFYVLSITWVAPKFGVANAISFVLLGQLISMTAIDHFQLFGVQHFPITLKKIAGLLFMVFGIFLVVRRS